MTIVSVTKWKNDPANAPRSQVEGPERPIVTILKPVCGSDPFQEEIFRTFFQQNSLNYQLIFGAHDSNDPALSVIRGLQSEFPNVDCQIISGGDILGCNRKVSNLIQMLPSANHPILVLSDSDMRVDNDYVNRIAAHFTNNEVGAVTCPYRGYRPEGFASKLEAIGIGADFIPSAFVAWYVAKMRFGFGSTIAVTKKALDSIGGLEPLVNELADDYLLVNRIARAGFKSVMSDVVVDDALGRETFAAMWSRRLRWAKTSRAMSPGPYVGSFVTHGIAISFLLTIMSGGDVVISSVFDFTVAVRILSALWITCYTSDEMVGRWWWLIPISDLFSFAIFIASLCGNTIVWRGERFRLGKGGSLTPVEKKNATMD